MWNKTSWPNPFISLQIWSQKSRSNTKASVYVINCSSQTRQNNTCMSFASKYATELAKKKPQRNLRYVAAMFKTGNKSSLCGIWVFIVCLWSFWTIIGDKMWKRHGIFPDVTQRIEMTQQDLCPSGYYNPQMAKLRNNSWSFDAFMKQNCSKSMPWCCGIAVGMPHWKGKGFMVSHCQCRGVTIGQVRLSNLTHVLDCVMTM